MRFPGVFLRAGLLALFLGFYLSAGLLSLAEVRYGTGTWDAGLYGNHRVVIRVSGRAGAVWLHIPWRRRDLNPERKKVILVDAATGTEIRNICPVAVNREAGDFVFEPATAPGDYYVYYLPNVMKGRSNYPTVVYPEPVFDADAGWLLNFGLAPFQPPAKDKGAFAQAQVLEIQSIDELNSFFPMEVIATAEETAALLVRYPDAPYLLFPEDRRFSVRMADDLPLRWIQSGPRNEFEGEALRGEFYAFQIGLFAVHAPIEDVEVAFSDLNLVPTSPPPRPLIPASAAHSFNTRGVNWDGKDFKKACAVPKGKIQPLWCGVQVPKDIPPGKYQGEVTVRPKGLPLGRIRLHFSFNLLLTPFKPIDPKYHFSTRFFHAFEPVEEVARTGANTINVHHANAVNLYINYPFLRPAEMRKYIDEAHTRGLKVKIYNTIRELSNHCVELFALRSLGDEIFSPGPGGGYSWLQEHLVSDYIAAWFVPELKDAAIINSGLSRWHNYYLEGLNWLVRYVGIDGLYIDDVAFDRTTMKRVRKILDRGRPGALVDLHSANQYNPRDGFASSANLYLEHFPFLNRLWFGEYFDYSSAPDYWLVEISGIPFGLMGEMLQDGGNAWRGMIYGMTNRLPWSGQNPARLWKVWDEFGIEEARMIGYWSADCPVKTDNPNVLATAYVKEGKVLVSLASWATEPVKCRLRINWEALGMNGRDAHLLAPKIADFQPEAAFRPDDPIPVEPGRGWLLELKSTTR